MFVYISYMYNYVAPFSDKPIDMYHVKCRCLCLVCRIWNATSHGTKLHSVSLPMRESLIGSGVDMR